MKGHASVISVIILPKHCSIKIQCTESSKIFENDPRKYFLIIVFLFDLLLLNLKVLGGYYIEL